MGYSSHFKCLAAGTALLVLLTGCGASPQQAATSTGTPVETQTVTRSNIATHNQLSGKVVPRNAVSIFAPQESDVLTVHVEVGDQVTTGQTLVTLDSSSIQREIEQVQGERSRTAALYDEQISLAQQQLENTQTLMEEKVRQAKQDWDNTQKLHEQGAASDLELDQAESTYSEAQLNADESINSARVSVSQLQTEKTNQLSTYDKTLADLADNQADQSIKATVSGTVTEVNVVKGGKASVQTAAVVIATDEAPQISMSVSETIQPWLTVGDTVDVQISALGNDTFQATIASVASAVNEQTQLYDVRLDLPQNIDAAYGMFATVTVDTDPPENAIVIPTDAILTDNESQYVFIVQDGTTAVRVDIESGLVGDGVTQVEAGLEEGNELVIVGQSYLADGAEVRVVTRDGEDVTQTADEETPTDVAQPDEAAGEEGAPA